MREGPTEVGGTENSFVPSFFGMVPIPLVVSHSRCGAHNVRPSRVRVTHCGWANGALGWVGVGGTVTDTEKRKMSQVFLGGAIGHISGFAYFFCALCKKSSKTYEET